MSKKSRKKLKRYVENLFDIVERHPIFLKIINWPRLARWVLSFVLVIFGLIGILTPIPGGWIMMTAAAVIIWGINPVKETSIRLLLRFKIHKLMRRVSRFFGSEK